jgi:glycosyltransferase involved in cell wall biosynthesis
MNLTPTDFCLISAVNDDNILEGCLKLSPDVVSGALTPTIIRGAQSMAEAYNAGLKQTNAPVCIFVHQDVYLPRGWLERATSTLNKLERNWPNWMVAGPYGVQKDGTHVGRVWDVSMDRELGSGSFEPTRIDSLDELMLIAKRLPSFQFDTDLPNFHLYGTDLVQTAHSLGKDALAVDLPLVHNNRPWASLSGDYSDAYRYVRSKWKHRLPLYSPVCKITYNPIPLWRVQWRRRRVSHRPAGLLADSVDVSRKAGYEVNERSTT